MSITHTVIFPGNVFQKLYVYSASFLFFFKCRPRASNWQLTSCNLWYSLEVCHRLQSKINYPFLIGFSSSPPLLKSLVPQPSKTPHQVFLQHKHTLFKQCQDGIAWEKVVLMEGPHNFLHAIYSLSTLCTKVLNSFGMWAFLARLVSTAYPQIII